MGLPTYLLDSNAVAVVDTSVLINLAATGCAAKILESLPNRVITVEAVLIELNQGRARGKPAADVIDGLISDGLIVVRELGNMGLTLFETLVVGEALDTLDDGEAATIACAAEIGGVAIIDERKANRLCAACYPSVRTGCSIDIFGHPDVGRSLGRAGLGDAVFNALLGARMRALPHYLDWVVDIIGKEKLASCVSLPISVRRAAD